LLQKTNCVPLGYKIHICDPGRDASPAFLENTACLQLGAVRIHAIFGGITEQDTESAAPRSR
jgi:hypothetical protein